MDKKLAGSTEKWILQCLLEFWNNVLVPLMASKSMQALLSRFYDSGSPDFDRCIVLWFTAFLVFPFFSRNRWIDLHAEMAADMKNLDTDKLMLVYENYNKFISATDTIRRFKENVSGMENSMDQLLGMVTAVRRKSDCINASLCERRERIEELNGTRSLLRKVQFIFDLPQRLRKCMSAEDHGGAVKHYGGALPILKAYAQSSFRKCKEESDAIMSNLIKRLQAQVMDRSVLLPARAEAVSLLQKLKALETSASREDVHAEAEKDFIQEFLDEAVTLREQFPNGEEHLLEASREFLDEYFETVQRSLRPESGSMSATQLNACFRHPTALTVLTGVVPSEQLSMDVTRMSVLASVTNLPARASEAMDNAVRNHVARQFQSLFDRIKASLTVLDISRKPDFKQTLPKTLKSFLEIAQKTIIDGSLEVLQDLKEIRKSYLFRWRDEHTDLVQGGFQELFTNLVDHFLFLCVRSVETPLPSVKSKSAETVTPSLVLLVSLLSVYLYQTAVPQITELVGTWFPGGGAMGSEGRPAFVPSEICRFLNSTGQRLLQQYVDIRARTLSVIVRKAVDSHNWLKFKEPEDVRMFTDLFLQEILRLQADVQQLLSPGPLRTHLNSDRSASIGSSRSASTREDGLRMVSYHIHTRSQSLERDVARLFTKKVEIFTKLEYNQPWVISTVVKMSLKTFQECVRLQTFSRGGHQQIQLDCYYLREPLQNLVDKGVVEFMLDEVCSAAAERCQDPVPLETVTLDRLVQLKKAKMESAKEETSS